MSVVAVYGEDESKGRKKVTDMMEKEDYIYEMHIVHIHTRLYMYVAEHFANTMPGIMPRMKIVYSWNISEQFREQMNYM